MSASVIGSLVFGRSLVAAIARRALEVRAFCVGGRASYGAYLYHVPVLYFFGLNDAVVQGAKMPLARVALAVAVTIAITTSSYHFIEKPLLSRKNRIPRDGVKTMPAPETPPASYAGEIGIVVAASPMAGET
jgi:peptidoglycan/LPS O-acetylase OafA/YrhL